MGKFIIVAGNIGVGKSTLVSLLSNYFGWSPYYEPVVENPYLADFYKDMPRWGFHSQVFFLTNRMQIHRQIMLERDSAIQDRSIYEDAEVFAKNLFLNGQFDERDYQTYRAIYETFVDVITPPDLMIYLRASVPTLQKRIAERNRSYENGIADAYLDRLNGLYEDWISHFDLCPVLTVPSDNLNYLTHPGHLNLVAQKITQRLGGVEEVNFNEAEIAKYE